MSDLEPGDTHPPEKSGPPERLGEDAPVVRASDADRERVHSYLSAAMSMGVLTPEEYSERAAAAAVARTRPELETLTRDLPLDQLGSAVAESATTRTRVSRSGAQPVASSTAIFGGSRVGGGAVVGDLLTATAIMGGVELDLRNVEYTAPVLELKCVAIMGGIEVTVPPDVTVEIHGSGILGAFDGSAAGPGDIGAPRLVIRGLALMGGVNVKRRGREDDIGPRRPR